MASDILSGTKARGETAHSKTNIRWQKHKQGGTSGEGSQAMCVLVQLCDCGEGVDY